MTSTLPFADYSSWIRQRFSFRVQKISIDAGFSCPNRDGRIAHGGCTFCSNDTFNPAYCDARKTVSQQLEEGKAFFRRKYPDMKYLAYFQAYSNTYAPLARLRQLYDEALGVDDVVGIVIGTRPDCVDDELLDYLAELSRRTFLVVEYGVESCFDDTLRRVNRGHDFACSARAIRQTHERGILCGAHVIIGLPGDFLPSDPEETRRRIVESARRISALPIDLLKIHQLQIIRHTPLAADYAAGLLRPLELDEYMQLLALYLEHLRPDIVLERFVSQSPPHLLLAPSWGLKNHEFTARFVKMLTQNVHSFSASL